LILSLCIPGIHKGDNKSSFEKAQNAGHGYLLEKELQDLRNYITLG